MFSLNNKLIFCSGGLMTYAFNYIKANSGIDKGESYPYTGVQGTCKYSTANIGATCTGYASVTSGSESALMTAVANGPISVAIDASRSSFQLYKSGVYYEPTCSSTSLNH
jgi:cathepsin L